MFRIVNTTIRRTPRLFNTEPRSILSNVSKEDIKQFVATENERFLSNPYNGTEDELKERIRGKSEAVEVKRRRLKMGSSKRGMAELDHILGAYAEAKLDNFTLDQLCEFEMILAETDTDLQVWSVPSSCIVCSDPTTQHPPPQVPSGLRPSASDRLADVERYYPVCCQRSSARKPPPVNPTLFVHIFISLCVRYNLTYPDYAYYRCEVRRRHQHSIGNLILTILPKGTLNRRG